jgi:hypothetical protein
MKSFLRFLLWTGVGLSLLGGSGVRFQAAARKVVGDFFGRPAERVK